MNEVVKSIKDEVKDRYSNPLYGTFVLSVIIVNWKFFYTLFFQGEKLLRIPKIEYIEKIYFENTNWMEHIFLFLIFPGILTYIFLYQLPKLSEIVYRNKLSFIKQKKLDIYKFESDLESQKTNLLKNVSEELDKQSEEIKKSKEKREEISKQISDEDKMRLEIENFKRTGNFERLEQLRDILYKEGGKTRKDNPFGGIDNLIDSDLLADLHINGYIELNGGGLSERATLTKKGKNLLSEYIKSTR